MIQLDHANIKGVPSYTPAQMRRWSLIVASCMTFLAAVAICLRLLSRRIRRQPLWWDDYMIMFSMVWNWVVVAIALAMYAEGGGYHSSTIGPEAVAHISKYLLVSEIIYIWHMCWTKLSVLLMYYRIFHVPSFKKLVILVGSFVVVWAITGTFLFTFICVPTQKLWYPNIPGHCVSETGVWVANASSTIFSDIAILVLPIPQIWKLQTKLSEKIGLTLVFGLGFFTTFTSSYRVWVLFNYSKSDVSYTLFPLLVWTDIEMCAAVISACLPTMRPFLRMASAKLGINCFQSRRPSTSQGSCGGRNTRGSNSANLKSLPSTTESARKSAGNTFYRLHEDTEMDDILRDGSEYRPEQWSRAGSKESWYLPSTLQIETVEMNVDDIPRGQPVLPPVYRLSSFQVVHQE